MEKHWLIRAPAGVWSTGPSVVYSESIVQEYRDDNLDHRIEGPFILAADAVDYLDAVAAGLETFHDTFRNPQREAPRLSGSIEALRKAARALEDQ